MTLQKFRDALLEIMDDIYHYHAVNKPNKYIVWAEDTESNSLNADNKKTHQIIQGTLDYFTRQEFDPIVQQIQDKLNEYEIPWRLESIQYEEETKYIHYEWSWEVDSLG